MARKLGNRVKWMAAGLAVSALAMSPALSRAFSARADGADGVSLSARGLIGSFTPAMADPEIAASFRINALRGNNNFRFTPAGSQGIGERAVTILVRQKSALGAVTIRENVVSANPGAAMLAAKLTPTSYSLGTVKGWKNFALPVKNLGSNLPDLADIGAGIGKSEKNTAKPASRFNTRFTLDAKSPAGIAPRALEASEKDYSLDVGGSYSLTRNLDVTAGVRYNNERDRMAPLTDSRQDSQAVYVGTQFRF